MADNKDVVISASMSDKEKAIQDLEKAIFYLKDEINMINNKYSFFIIYTIKRFIIIGRYNIILMDIFDIFLDYFLKFGGL